MLSPCATILGLKLDFKHYCSLEFGEDIQMHEVINNALTSWTVIHEAAEIAGVGKAENPEAKLNNYRIPIQNDQGDIDPSAVLNRPEQDPPAPVIPRTKSDADF